MENLFPTFIPWDKKFKSTLHPDNVQMVTARSEASKLYAPIIVLPEGGNPGRTSGNPGECQIYMEQSLTFSRDLGKGGKLNSPGPWGMPIDNFLWIICYHS